MQQLPEQHLEATGHAQLLDHGQLLHPEFWQARQHKKPISQTAVSMHLVPEPCGQGDSGNPGFALEQWL